MLDETAVGIDPPLFLFFRPRGVAPLQHSAERIGQTNGLVHG